MNRSINKGSILFIVIPVFKSGSKSGTSNYRPISVLPVFAKIQEKAVHGMVYDFLLKHKLLSSYQSGFHPLLSSFMAYQATLEYSLSSRVQNSTADLYCKYSSLFDKFSIYCKKNYL